MFIFIKGEIFLSLIIYVNVLKGILIIGFDSLFDKLNSLDTQGDLFMIGVFIMHTNVDDINSLIIIQIYHLVFQLLLILQFP